MHIVKENYLTKDRWVLNITKLEPGQTRQFTPTGTDYVLLAGADMLSQRAVIKQATAACTLTDQYEIDCGEHGFAAVISCAGICLPENIITLVDPTKNGNLSYMDGGTNTNAINPSREGDPVVNYVYFPTAMNQTPHIHPSHRIGLVIDGNGITRLPEIDSDIILTKGDLFFMERMVLHQFITDGKTPCVLFVFAPDSETGPTDEANPLKARTYIQKRR